ncbi:MAG: GGDEF domain-containing protein [Rhodospirillaceae bacterium]|nr:GGDEF domain-containing protein [Rhodospirillaceae bacterium]
MKLSTRIALAYLILSIIWIATSDPLLSSAFPSSFPSISLYKGWVFVVITALLLKVWLSAEETRRDIAEAKLQEISVTDALTGMRNRTAFIEHLEHAVHIAARENRHFGLLFIDVDNFKGVNDGHGHAIGDGLLCEVGNRIQATIRASDIASRLGGDEFVILVRSSEDLTTLSTRILTAMHRPFVIQDMPLAITVSIGMSRYPEHGTTADTLLHAADAAMYRAKAEGRNRAIDATN